MLMRCARRSLPLLIAAALALSLSACTSEPGDGPPTPVAATPSPALVPSPSPAPTATPPPTPTVTPSPTPTATPSPTATPAGTPSPTPTPTPTATPSPAPTATPSPTPTATPSPTPTATPAPLITAEDLGIREVDTAEALAAAGLTHVRYAAGEEVPWEAGFFLLDVATGAVEGWVVSEGDSVDEEGKAVGTVSVHLSLSPGNRFLLLPGDALHDRMTGRTYAGARVVVQSSYPNDLVGWGLGSDERLVLSSGTAQAYVVVDGEMQPVAKLAGASADLWPHPEGRYLFAHDRSQLQLFDLMYASSDALAPSFTWSLDWVTWCRRSATLSA